MEHEYGIVANVLSDKTLRIGAKVWILDVNGDFSCPLVQGLSISGRLIRKYTKFKRLSNYRAAWIPPALRENVMNPLFTTRDAANQWGQEMNVMWQGVRFYNYKGEKLRDGISENQMFDNRRSKDL